MRYFSVYDKKAAAFLPVFASRTKQEAMRSFGDAVADPKHQFCVHPEDYLLFYVGEFDDNTGVFTSEVLQLVTALECVPK